MARARREAKPPRPTPTADASPPNASPAPAAVRLQKILADAGVASRRAAERLIVSGKVTVNGYTVTELGARADPATDDVRVEGGPVRPQSGHLYVALHKPRGYVTTARDERGRPTVLDLVRDVPARLFPVGRLDLDSEGLLLLTNDGALTARLTHPRYGVEKEYRVLVSPEPRDDAVAALTRGVMVEGRRTAPARVRRLESDNGHYWLEVVIHEGRKRQVRLMCAAAGLTVHRLIRTRVGPIRLGRLEAGAYRLLTADEVRRLR